MTARPAWQPDEWARCARSHREVWPHDYILYLADEGLEHAEILREVAKRQRRRDEREQEDIDRAAMRMEDETKP